MYYEICASKELINRENVISSYCVFNRATYDEKKKKKLGSGRIREHTPP